MTPVSYSEEPIAKKKRLSEDEDILLREGSKPEVYTEEHEELLGSTERSWELFVDGCGKDGKRVYDSIQGKTCHQCRCGSIPFSISVYLCFLCWAVFMLIILSCLIWNCYYLLVHHCVGRMRKIGNITYYDMKLRVAQQPGIFGTAWMLSLSSFIIYSQK